MARLEVFGREEFIAERFDCAPGHHLTIIGPTGSGKTYLGYQLLRQVTSVETPGVVLVMKPRDATVTKWSKEVEFPIVREWPPSKFKMLGKKPDGYVLWPKHQFDPDKDDEHIRAEFRKAILSSYQTGNRYVFGDEMYGIINDLNLARECVTVWTRGRSMNTGLWAVGQKPTHMPLHAYNQAMHLFLARDPDKRSRDRFAEISGVDPDLVRRAVFGLDKHQFLYIKQDGPRMCVVDK